MTTLSKRYEIDKKAWDDCAETYEKQIVGGHPDILAFENFEEDLLDYLIGYLAKKNNRHIRLMDIGCGSGRLHIRYGAKTSKTEKLPESHPLVDLKEENPVFEYDPLMKEYLDEVWGIDFSQNMINLAAEKLNKYGLGNYSSVKLSLEQGSAFDLKPHRDNTLPIAICLVNSIGVMQGYEGAKQLFKAMRRVVERAKGIAIVSCYQREYIASYGLGQYESTMDVSGQPQWLVPDTYASGEYVQVPKDYKLAHSKEDKIIVDVYDSNGKCIKEDHVLERDPVITRQVIDTGNILTHSDYRSHWYSFKEIHDLVKEHWNDGEAYHVPTEFIDMQRAEPAQMAILDYGNNLDKYLFDRWKL